MLHTTGFLVWSKIEWRQRQKQMCELFSQVFLLNFDTFISQALRTLEYSIYSSCGNTTVISASCATFINTFLLMNGDLFPVPLISVAFWLWLMGNYLQKGRSINRNLKYFFLGELLYLHGTFLFVFAHFFHRGIRRSFILEAVSQLSTSFVDGLQKS